MNRDELKQKAQVLKLHIEDLLKEFRSTTGYTPSVTIETKTKKTNDGHFTQQKVTVTLVV